MKVSEEPVLTANPMKALKPRAKSSEKVSSYLAFSAVYKMYVDAFSMKMIPYSNISSGSFQKASCSCSSILSTKVLKPVGH